MTIQPNPLRRIKKRFTGQRPTLEVELFEFIPATLEYYIALLAHPLNLRRSCDQFKKSHTIKAAQRNNYFKITIYGRCS